MSIRDIFAKHGATLAGTPAAKFDPLPPGSYAAEIDRCDHSQSSGGHECLKLTFRVTDGEHASRRFWLDLYFTPDAMKYTKAYLDALGATDDSPADWWKGVRVSAVLAVRKSDQGNESNRVKSLIRLAHQPHPADLPPLSPAAADVPNPPASTAPAQPSPVPAAKLAPAPTPKKGKK